MYQIYCDGHCLYDPTGDDLLVLNPKCNLGVNTVGEGSFTILSNHPHYGNLKKLKSVFEIRQDNDVIFRGRMTNNTRDFYNRMDVDLEGVLAYTNDSVVPPFNFPGGFEGATEAANIVDKFMNYLVWNHNEQVEDWQKLKLGRVTVRDPNNYITRSSDQYQTTWEILKTKLFDSGLGGYLCIRYESDGNYLDYLESFDDTNSQPITFGENLLDIISESDGADTYSAILPRGAQLENSKKEKYTLTLAGLPDGDLNEDLVKKDEFIYSKSAKAEYGWICAPVADTTWDDVTEVENLKTKAMEYLSGVAMLFSNTITIKAVDLSFTDDQIQSFRVGQNITVNSPVHGVVNAVYPLTQLNIDLANPQDTIISIGDTVRTLIDINNTTQSNNMATVGTAQSVVQVQVNTVAGKVDAQQTTLEAHSMILSNLSDKVTETAIGDPWAYRKWSSGIAECWAILATDAEVVYPVTFIGDPCIQVTENGDQKHYYIIGKVSDAV